MTGHDALPPRGAVVGGAVVDVVGSVAGELVGGGVVTGSDVTGLMTVVAGATVGSNAPPEASWTSIERFSAVARSFEMSCHSPARLILGFSRRSWL